MSNPAFLSILSVLAVSLISFAGIGFFLMSERITKALLLYVVSFSTGALFGDVFLHLLPEMSEGTGVTREQSVLLLLGIVLSFCVEKFIHWHHCHHLPSETHRHPVGTMMLIADGLHNAIDGVLIAGSFLIDVRVGIATTIAVALHEIPQEIGDYALLLFSGYGRVKALLLNFLSGLTAVLAAVLTILASSATENATNVILPIAAGNLLYIAGSDLIPELHKATRIREGFLQLLGILAGIGVMALLLLLEEGA